MAPDRRSGVSGTVDAFNFIRRVGFPSIPRGLAIFSAIALLSGSISLLPSNENLAQTLAFVGAVPPWTPVIGEFINPTLILSKITDFDFSPLIRLDLTSLLPHRLPI